MENNNFLSKGEIKFWLATIGSIVAGVIAFNTLKMKVQALEETKGEIYPKIEKILLNQVKMQKDIDYIKQKIE